MNILSKFFNSFELKIAQWNCFKMTQTRLHEFRLFLEQFQPDIVSIQEIKMNKEQANFFLRFDGYKVYYKPRITGDPECGGGTSVVVKGTVDHSQSPTKTPTTLGLRLKRLTTVLILFRSIPPPIRSKKKQFLDITNMALVFF
jgi:exonuclease III